MKKSITTKVMIFFHKKPQKDVEILKLFLTFAKIL